VEAGMTQVCVLYVFEGYLALLLLYLWSQVPKFLIPSLPISGSPRADVSLSRFERVVICYGSQMGTSTM
jgi:hypothetical protein